MTLFRSEVLQAQGCRHLGTIRIASHWVSWALAAGGLCWIALLLALLVFGEYTRRAAVSGYLVPETGVVRVHSPIAGRLKTLYVHEGQAVVAGAPLAVVMDERVVSEGGEVRAATLRQIEVREASLRRSMGQQITLVARMREGLEGRIEALAQELDQLQAEMATQRTRLSYAEATRSKYRELLRQGFVSATAEQERAEAAAEQQSRLQAMERSGTALHRELLGLRSELAELPIRERSQLADLERTLAQTVQEGIESQARAAVVVTAQRMGRVSGLNIDVGQPVGPERPLLSLVPDGAALEAHLFVPSKDMGFVRSGQEVALRYGAFPFQKFGHYRGVITEVSRTPLGAGELAYPLAAKLEASSLVPASAVSMPSAEPLFRIKVRLDRQTAQAYGEEQALQPGMQLEADVLLDRRTLLEWILEPAHSLHGKYSR